MATSVKNESSVFIEKEVTEGTYVAESSGASAIEVLADGLEFTPSREVLERNNLTSTVETVVGRSGTKSMTGTVPVELRGGDSEGAAPEATDLWEALLGGMRSGTASTSKASGNTSTNIEIEDADISKYSVGDVVLIKEAGSYERRPISAVASGVGVAAITLEFALSFTPSASVVVAAFTTYYSSTGAPTLSATNYLGGVVREKALGCRPVSAEISNFSTGQLADVSFSLEGLTYEREVGTPLFTPTFSTALPPVILNSKIYQSGTELEVNEMSVSMNNTLGFKTSTASSNGKISSRITKFAVTGSINPYQDGTITNFTNFDTNAAFSLYSETANPSGTAGETEEHVSVWMPNCRAPELVTGDVDGLMTDEISYTAHRNLGNDTIFISFS